MKKTIFFCFAFFVSLHITDAQTKAEKKAAKAEKEQTEYVATQALLDSKSYTFEADWARTQKGRRISLVGNPNHLKVNNNDTQAHLPYFGVAQNVTYGGSGAISFECELSDYEIKKNDKKKKIVVSFKAKDKSEQVNLTLTVYHSGSASLYVSSISRNGITYDGKVKVSKNIEE